nr:ABC transporter ATP-binding protein [uncultured Lachnoclostridium sp.]
MKEKFKWLKKLLFLLTPYKKEMIAIFVLLLICSGLNLLIPLVNKEILDKGFIEGNYNLLCELVALVFVLQLVSANCKCITAKKRIYISNGIQFDLQEKAFLHIMKLENRYFVNKNTTELLGRIDTDIQYMKGIIDGGFFSIIIQCLTVIGGLIGLFMIDYRLTFCVLLFIPIKVVVVKHIMKQQEKQVGTFLRESSRFAGWFGDCVNGIREVKLFQLIHYKKLEFDKFYKEMLESNRSMKMLNQYNQVIDESLMYFLMFLIYMIGGKLVMNHSLTLGSVITFITYSGYVTGPITFFLNIGVDVSTSIPSVKRFYQFMEEAEEKEVNYEESVEIDSVETIAFQNVTFSYDKKCEEQNQADKVTFEVGKQSKVAIIGENGSGKSTIINLLLRFYTPDSGKIYINNIDISKLSLNAYRELFGVVSQQVYLFQDTIRNNICLFKQHSDEEIIDILIQCGMGEFIEENGLDYIVGDNGSMLSGGQKQKIALARALILNRPILVFDEATSNADVFTEEKILNMLKNELKEKIVLIVTHKREIIDKMDFVIMLKNGRINFKGNVRELRHKD